MRKANPAPLPDPLADLWADYVSCAGDAGQQHSAGRRLLRFAEGLVRKLASSLAPWLSGNDRDEVLQEGLFRFLRKYDRKIGRASSFLARIYVNLLLEMITNRRPKACLTDPDSNPSRQPSADELFHQAEQIADELARTEGAIANLPSPKQDVFILHNMKGLEHQEIAKVLRITENQSKSMNSSALIEIRHVVHGGIQQ